MFVVHKKSLCRFFYFARGPDVEFGLVWLL